MTSGHEFDTAFRDVFEEVFGFGVEIGDGDGPATIADWDSLAQVRLVHTLETRFGIRLPDAALLEEQTASSLKGLVRDQVARS